LAEGGCSLVLQGTVYAKDGENIQSTCHCQTKIQWQYGVMLYNALLWLLNWKYNS